MGFFCCYSAILYLETKARETIYKCIKMLSLIRLTNQNRSKQLNVLYKYHIPLLNAQYRNLTG